MKRGVRNYQNTGSVKTKTDCVDMCINKDVIIVAEIGELIIIYLTA